MFLTAKNIMGNAFHLSVALICILGTANAFPSSAQDNVLEMVQTGDMDDIIEDLKLAFEEYKENGKCSCTGLNCQCCQELNIRQLRLHANCCIKLGYDSQSGNVFVSLTIGDREIWKSEFPVGSPPPACIGIPVIKLAKACLEFYDFRVEGKTFTGCTKINFKLAGKEIVKVKLGCFRINFLDSAAQPIRPSFIRLIETIRIQETILPIEEMEEWKKESNDENETK